MCPPVTPGMMGTCVEECSTNSQCPKGTMCCSNGCGHTCQVPVSRMRGKCPSYNKDTVGICVGNGAGGKKCSGDMDCKNGDLCCNNGCGPVCTPADTKTPCQRELAMAMIQMRTSLDSCSPIFIPRCDRKGNYHRTQCYDNNGVCFCVNPNGTKIAGTEVRGNPDCSKATKPGTCPAIVSVSKSDLICSSTCQSDDDCIGSDKCCTNGCAYHCSPAVFKDGAFCIYKPYIDTTVTYVGVVASIKMASAEACKAACDKDTLADCIGVVYQKDNGGRCAKYTDQTHITKTPLKGSVYYERLCQFSAGLCRNQSSVLMSDGVPKTCNHDNDCGVQSFGCEGGHCCPRLNRPPTIPPMVLCKSGGIVIKDTNGLVKSCSLSTPCGAGEECEDSVCCPKAILQGLCPENREVLMEDGSPKTCMTDQECGVVGYKCQGQLGSKYCCPGPSAQVVCPNGGIPQKVNNLPKSCTSDTQCGLSYTCKGSPGSKHCCPTKLYKLDVCPNNGMVFISDGRPKRCTVNADCLGGIGVYTCVDNYCCPQKVNQNMCPHNGRVLKINGQPRTCTADIECQGSRQGSFSCQQGYCCPRSNICPDGKEPKCCDIKLCLYHACPLAPRAACRINPCGGCKVEFYDRFNNIVNCTAGLTKCQEKQQKTVEVSMMWVDTTGYTSVETDGLVQQISNEGLDDQDTTVVPKPLDSKPGQCPGGDLHDTGVTSTSPCTTDSECAGDKKCCYNGNNTYCRLPVIVPMTKGHCEKPPVVGLCEGYFIRYFFNSTSRKCEQFVYGGCHGNENNFQTLEACQRGCIEGTPQECLESPDRGQCKAYIPMFFYNVNSGKCEKFIYGGCQGNSNKFTTLQQCYATCTKGTLPNGAGVHMPDCMADGRYAPVQCQGALCWCVHNSGKMIPGSMTLGRPQCNTCPDGSLPQICDTCLTARCGGRPAVKCLADPCNNCAVKFVDRSGSAVNCGDKCNGVKPAVIQGISDLECGNRKKVWYYNKITQTCQETFVCTHHASSPSVYASKLECQSECTASVCGGSGPMTCTTTCNNLSCKRFPSAVCRVNPCTCNTEFYDPVTNLQVNCDVVTPICQIQRAQMMLSVTPSKLKQDVTEYVCNVRGEFLPQQCDRAKHCWCVDGLGKMTSQKKVTVRNIAQSIGCKENKTKSAVLSVTYNVDYDSVIKGKENSFKRAFMQRLQEITPEIRQYVQKIMLRRGSVIVDVVLITPDSDAEVKDVGAFVNLLSSEISKGLAVTFDGKLLVSETAVNSRLSFEQEPESLKAPVTDTEDRKTVLIVVLTVVLSAVLITAVIVICVSYHYTSAYCGAHCGTVSSTHYSCHCNLFIIIPVLIVVLTVVLSAVLVTAVIVICLVKRRGGKFSSLEEGKESPRMSNDMYFHNAACEKK
ncbi:hypothetical protein FSP39_021894 [Pinctada imbricata]|uniref:Uncharacterized protein n=1 Tax=Pinctada imbricata TaxID=66713 RepID=A0AA89BZQ9_PINIB|nr:hypothetical protein FSP39_021894 [Pinctada imbricata]